MTREIVIFWMTKVLLLIPLICMPNFVTTHKKKRWWYVVLNTSVYQINVSCAFISKNRIKL